MTGPLHTGAGEEALRAEKAALRRRLRAQLAGLDAAYCARSNTAITARLLALPWYLEARTVFFYLSVGAEPDTRAAVEAALAAGKAVCAPVCRPGGVMEARRLFSLGEAAPGFYNLPEPPHGAPLVPPGQIDLVVAPCVAADEKGRRLGNGGGYYDRYLARVSCPVVCLCRGRLLQGALPAQGFDIPVGKVLTEEGEWPNEDV